MSETMELIEALEEGVSDLREMIVRMAVEIADLGAIADEFVRGWPRSET